MNLIAHLYTFIGASRRTTDRQRARKAVLGRAASPGIETLELRQLLSATTPTDANPVGNSIQEGAAVGALVGITASSTDPIGGTAITYSLSDDAGGRFAINPASGVVTVANRSLLDGPATLGIVVTATDGTGSSASQSFSIGIINVAPKLRIGGNASVDAGSPYTLDLSSGDPGADTITSWTIDWGDGGAPETFAGNPSSVTHVYARGQPRPTLGTVLLNELKVNTPGQHSPHEYVELRGDPGAPLDNLYFISVEGDADPEPNEPLGAGTVELVVSLTGRSLGASGLLVITGTLPGHVIRADTTVVTTAKLDTAGKALENGSNSFLLVSSPTPIIEGTDYDANDDGVLELPAGAVVLDGIGWSDGGALDKVYATAILRQPLGAPDAATRFFGDTTPNSPAAWFNGLLVGETDSVTYNTARTSVNFPSGGELTPGGANVPVTVLPQPRLNELKVNPPTAADGPYEYIELKGAPDQTLIRLFFVAIEGDASATPGGVGRADMVVNLSGASLGSNGLLVIQSTAGGHAAPGGTTVLTDTQLDASAGGLENGSISFLLVASLLPIIEGTDYDVDNDGVLELPPGAIIVDAVAWSDGDSADVTYGGVVLRQAGGGAAHAATRFAHDSTFLSAASWYSGALEGTTSDSLTYDVSLASANLPAGGALTPGNDNAPTGSPPPPPEPPAPGIFVTPNGYTITARATDEDGTWKANTLVVTVDAIPRRFRPVVRRDVISAPATKDDGARAAIRDNVVHHFPQRVLIRRMQ